MSTVKANRVQLGQSGTATQNFTVTAEAADGTMKLARGVAGSTTQDIITINAAGEIDFPQMIRSLVGAAGYQKLPGGLIVQWGEGAYATDTPVTFPIAFPTNNAFKVIMSAGNFDNGQASPNKIRAMSAYNATKTGFTASSNTGVAAAGQWIAIGN